MCFPLMVTERFCFEWRPAPPSHRGGGNGGATAARWPSLLSAAGDPGAFRPQRNPPNGGAWAGGFSRHRG